MMMMMYLVVVSCSTLKSNVSVVDCDVKKLIYFVVLSG